MCFADTDCVPFFAPFTLLALAAFGTVAASQGTAFAAKPGDPGESPALVPLRRLHFQRLFWRLALTAHAPLALPLTERKSIFGNAVASSSKVLGRAAEATSTLDTSMSLLTLRRAGIAVLLAAPLIAANSVPDPISQGSGGAGQGNRAEHRRGKRAQSAAGEFLNGTAAVCCQPLHVPII